MWRLIKLVFWLVLLGGVALVAYAYVGPVFFPDDFAAPEHEMTRTRHAGAGLTMAPRPRPLALALPLALLATLRRRAGRRRAAVGHRLAVAQRRGRRSRRPPRPAEPPVAEERRPPQIIVVTPLDSTLARRPSACFRPTSTGLPRDAVVGQRRRTTLTTLIAGGADRRRCRRCRRSLQTLMLAEADPPLRRGPETALFLARIDKLLDLGALTQAQALLEAAGPAETAERFRRWFDIALLTGTEDAACAAMPSRPALAPDPARAGLLPGPRGRLAGGGADAEHRAVALGDVTDAEDGAAGAVPRRRTSTRPAARCRRRRGSRRWSSACARRSARRCPPPTCRCAFAHADLRADRRLAARLEAAERLARARRAPGRRRCSQLYTERTARRLGRGLGPGGGDPGASTRRLRRARPAAVAAALPAAWAAMQAARTEVAFAEALRRAARRTAADRAQAPPWIARSPLCCRRPTSRRRGRTTDARPRFLRPSPAATPRATRARRCRSEAPSSRPSPTPRRRRSVAELLAEGRLGEALLRAIAGLRRRASRATRAR